MAGLAAAAASTMMMTLTANHLILLMTPELASASQDLHAFFKTTYWRASHPDSSSSKSMAPH